MKTLKVPDTLYLLVLLAGCGPQGQTRAPLDEATATAAASLTAAPAILSFNADWTQKLEAPLTVGGQVRVIYDAARLDTCRGEFNGKPAWSITGYYQLDGGHVGSFEAGGYSPSSSTEPALFNLPSGSGDLAIWFQITNRWGCSVFDSNFGKNYHFNVSAPATIRFSGDWSTTLDGAPGGTSVKIEYDLQRLPHCRQGYNGLPTWDTLVFYRFDGGPVSYSSVTSADGFVRSASPAVLAIPTGARELELWFKNNDRGGCVTYDSQYGKNYRFALTQ